MARQLPLLGEQRLSELEAAWKSERRDWARQRRHVIRMVARHEHSAQEIADALGVSRPTVFNYLKAFVQKRVGDFCTVGCGIGRPAVVAGKVREELIESKRHIKHPLDGALVKMS